MYSQVKCTIYESAISVVKSGVVIAWSCCPHCLKLVSFFDLLHLPHCKLHRSTESSNCAPRLHYPHNETTFVSLSTRNTFYALRRMMFERPAPSKKSHKKKIKYISRPL